jgi:hypothetical protein
VLRSIICSIESSLDGKPLHCSYAGLCGRTTEGKLLRGADGDYQPIQVGAWSKMTKERIKTIIQIKEGTDVSSYLASLGLSNVDIAT